MDWYYIITFSLLFLIFTILKTILKNYKEFTIQILINFCSLTE